MAGLKPQSESVPPVFIKDKDISSMNLTLYQMCTAVASLIGASNLVGVQKIQNLWRIYVKDKATRLNLCIKKSIVLNGRHINLFDQNPYVVFDSSSQNRKDKLTVKNLPLSVCNEEITKFLTEKDIVAASTVRYGYIRDDSGQLTSYKSGDRFVYVEPLVTPIKHQQHIGLFNCVIVHHGKTVKCVACGVDGHKVGDDVCEAKPEGPISTFRGYQHPLSNHYPCDIQVFSNNFSSVEHAYLWRMATELNKPDIAYDIKHAKHAGVAKRLASSIADEDVLIKWELDNTDVMQMLLSEKAKQCDVFRQCLLENTDHLLAEATNSKVWGTGLSPFITRHCAPTYWPGQNRLGAMLMELRGELISGLQSHATTVANDVVDADADEKVGDTATAISEQEAASSTSRASRPSERSPPSERAPRSFSTPSRRVVDRKAQQQQQDIRLAFRADSSKRKTPETSPEGISSQPAKFGKDTG